MLDHVALEKVLFLDIETVAGYGSYAELPAAMHPLWEHKARSLADAEATPEASYAQAGLFAEFGKIVCISLGYMTQSGSQRGFRTLSFFGDDEERLLSDFATLLHERFASPGFYLCAHNGKGFDFPYLCRRMLIQGVRIPSLLDTTGKKPWEVHHLDTMEIWKFGEWKSHASLNLLAHVFDIPTPKDDIDGSQVNATYWVAKDLERIEVYCRKDVLTVAQVFLRLRGQPLISEENVVLVRA